jgi:hypothetical protein
MVVLQNKQEKTPCGHELNPQEVIPKEMENSMDAFIVAKPKHKIKWHFKGF